MERIGKRRNLLVVGAATMVVAGVVLWKIYKPKSCKIKLRKTGGDGKEDV